MCCALQVQLTWHSCLLIANQSGRARLGILCAYWGTFHCNPAQKLQTFPPSPPPLTCRRVISAPLYGSRHQYMSDAVCGYEKAAGEGGGGGVKLLSPVQDVWKEVDRPHRRSAWKWASRQAGRQEGCLCSKITLHRKVLPAKDFGRIQIRQRQWRKCFQYYYHLV